MCSKGWWYSFVTLGYFVVFTNTKFLSHPKFNFHYVVQMIEDKVESSEEGNVTSVQTSFGTSYSDCGSHATIKNLTVTPCDGKRNGDVCEIERGSNVTFNLSFVPKQSATHLTAVIHGIYDFVPIPFPCPQPDACHNSGIDCPLQVGKLYDYQLTAQVLTKYPKIKLWIKGQLEDENGGNVICIKIHVQLV